MWRALVLSPGKPRRALEAFHATPAAGMPTGVYATAPEVGLWVVVLSELPETPDTLCLRVLAKGGVQRRAIRELLALPVDAWERCLIEILVRWRIEVAVQATLTPDDEDFMTATHDLDEEFKQKLRDEGRLQGLSQGLSQGRSQGLRPLVHLFERRLGRALSAVEHDALLTRFSTLGPDRLGDVVLDLAPDALAAWLADPAAR